MRREFIALVGSVVACPRGAWSQQSSTIPLPKIGILSNSSGASASPVTVGVITELRRLGWVDGQNAIYEPRFSAGDPDRLPSLAADLVDRKVHIIVTLGGSVILRAAQRVTATIPIVGLSDSLAGEGVTSLARPGSNTTGVSIFAADLDTKRLELLAEMVPTARRIAALVESKSHPTLTRVTATARERNMELVVFEAQRPNQLADALAAVSAAGVRPGHVLAPPVLRHGRRTTSGHKT